MLMMNILQNISDFLSYFELLLHIKKQKKIDYEVTDSEINKNNDNINNNINENENNRCSCNITFNLSSMKPILLFIFLLDFYNRSTFYISYKIIEIDNTEVSQKLARDMLIMMIHIQRVIKYVQLYQLYP